MDPPLPSVVPRSPERTTIPQIRCTRARSSALNRLPARECPSCGSIYSHRGKARFTCRSEGRAVKGGSGLLRTVTRGTRAFLRRDLWGIRLAKFVIAVCGQVFGSPQNTAKILVRTTFVTSARHSLTSGTIGTQDWARCNFHPPVPVIGNRKIQPIIHRFPTLGVDIRQDRNNPLQLPHKTLTLTLRQPPLT